MATTDKFSAAAARSKVTASGSARVILAKARRISSSNGVYSGPRKLDHQLSYSGGPRKGVLMAGKRKQHSAAFKAQVALAALKGDAPSTSWPAQFGVHPTLIHGWKKQLLDRRPRRSSATAAKAATADAEAEKAELFEQIGRLKMELEWLKKKIGRSPECHAAAGRTGPPGVERPAAVRTARAVPVEPVLRAGPGDRRRTCG